MIDRVVNILISLKLTVICLALAMVIIFVGTLAQVDLGIHAAQEKYFQSFLIYGSVPGSSWQIPILPGGYLIGTVLLINLIAAHVYRFQLRWNKLGIFLVHIGIFLLLVGGLLTDMLSEESQMRIREGQTKNYSESVRNVELAIVETSQADFDEIVSIPDRTMAKNKVVQHPSLPFRINVLNFFPNSNVRMRQADDKAPEMNAASGVTHGLGRNLIVNAAAPATAPNEMDVATTIFEIVSVEGSLGTWLCSTAVIDQQSFRYQNKTYEMQLRPLRYYKPFVIQLLDFSHDQYAGTTIPKNFSSKIRLVNPTAKEDREVLIYMNNPLRYMGETYYQSGFEPDNTTTILQVIRNPSWITPYLACSLVGIGLVIQFSIHLSKFFKRRNS
jgi:hypothetical protein